MGTDIIWFALLVTIFFLSMATVVLSIELRASNREKNLWIGRYFRRY